VTLAHSITLPQCMACSHSIKAAESERSYTGYFSKNIEKCLKLDLKVYLFFRHKLIFIVNHVIIFISMQESVIGTQSSCTHTPYLAK
jgi:hypothetical protein